MTSGRAHIPRDIAADVVMSVKRRCCLCWHIDGRKDVRQGQIAHLNRRRDDHRSSNLVFLCLEHHDAYDSKTSQSKNFIELEVRRYRDLLIEHFGKSPPDPAVDDPSHEISDADGSASASADETTSASKPRWLKPWRFPMQQIADQPEFFAFTTNTSHGICQIERVHLPDGRIVIICVDIAGNPGKSITNAAETIAEQVCYRFGIPRDRLVWLEHYADAEPRDWRLVEFLIHPQDGFVEPVWTKMNPKLWRELGLSPIKPTPTDGYRLSTRVKKHFPWPPADGPALYHTVMS